MVIQTFTQHSITFQSSDHNGREYPLYHVEVSQNGELIHETYIEDEATVSEVLIAAAWQAVIDRIDNRIVPIEDVTNAVYGSAATPRDSD